MLQVDVIAVGKLKERFWVDACDEYLKRLGGYAKVAVCEVPDSTAAQESQRVLAHVGKRPQAHVVLLDVGGAPTSSEQLAEKLDGLATQGVSHIVFVVGGSEGVDGTVRAAANERMSFGPITLPHNLARVVLLEQIYRAFKINRGEPYHK